MRLEHCIDNFISNVRGKPTGLFFLKNSKGSIAAFTNYGARWVGLELQTRNGIVDPVCGFNSIEPYRGPGDAYYGSIIGRFANRIAGGKFTLNEKQYRLPVNNGPNHLHGGPGGLHQVVWDMIEHSPDVLKLKYVSPDCEGGYPGELEIIVEYHLTEENEVFIHIKAFTSAETILNLTNHAYFNLNGGGSINDHFIRIHSKHFLPVTKDLIPLGEISKVEGPFDLSEGILIGDGLANSSEQLSFAGGYDHCFVPEGKGYRKVAEVEVQQLKMECHTDQPGLQFYSGNFMNGVNTFRNGQPDNFRTGFCLEAQKFPDSPNQPGFTSTVLLPGETYEHTTRYRFITG